jgi:hypothetical protein
MEIESADNGIWSRVSDDGKHAVAGMRLGAAGTKPGAGGEDQPYDGHGRYLGSASSGGLSGGNEVRGTVSPPKEKYPPPPPAPKEPHLTYRQSSGELTGRTAHESEKVTPGKRAV